MTEERDLPSLRRVFVAAAAAFTAIGILRGSVQLIAGARPVEQALYLYRVTLFISWFWIPVAVLVAVAWRWRSLRAPFIAAHAVLLSGAVAGEVLWTAAVIAAFGVNEGQPRFAFRLIGRFDTNLLIYAAIVGAVWAADSIRRANETRLAAARLESLLAGTRLHVLTLQLHPHFLFNTLNLISQLAYRDAAAARRTLGNLRALLVESLSHAGRRDVPLRDELRFLGAYLEIQQRRFGDRLRVRVDVADDALDVAVPHLLLQPLVENAIIHGLANTPLGGELAISARVVGDRLTVSVENDGVGLDPRSLTERVGLTNTRLRLHEFSGDDYRLSLLARPSGGTAVTIVVPMVAARNVGPNASGADVDVDADATTAEMPRRASRLAIGVQTIAGWAGVAILWTELGVAQQYVRDVPIVWGPAFMNSVANAVILAALTPAVLWVARRLDLVESRSWRKIGGHALAAMSLAAIHLAALLAYLYSFVPSEFMIERRNVFAWTVWDIVAYATIVMFGTIATLAGRHREALVAMIATRSRIANARLASLRLRLQPAVLLRGLDAIGVAMSTDPEQAEHTIARMGDLLRALLTGVDRDSVSLDTELATLRAFVDVVAPRATIATDDTVRDAIVPAVLLTPLAAALAELSSIDIHSTDKTLDVHLHASSGAVDDGQVAHIRERVRRRYRGDATLSVVSTIGGGCDIRLQLPIEPSVLEEDDSLFVPALGVA